MNEEILCIASFERGADFIRQAARMGCRVSLLTIEKLKDCDWPHESLVELLTMPENLTPVQIRNTVAYLARTRRFERIIALDEFDLETAAQLREHLCVPGLGISRTSNYRDKLAMRTTARAAGFLVPEFTRVINDDELRSFMEKVPAPWLLKPRSSASSLGIQKAYEAETIWRALEELGDERSNYVLEQFVPGDIYHVDAIVSEAQVVWSAAHKYGKPPMSVMHEGGVFTTRTLDRSGEEWESLTRLNQELVPALGLIRGVTHAEYIRAHADGRYYFLEVAARVGGAFIAEVIEYGNGVDLWVEWAKLEVANLRGEIYQLPSVQLDYAGSVLCLAKQEQPDTSSFTASEVVYRMSKHHHAGLIVKSEDPERVRALLEEYSQQFVERYLAVAAPPPRPVA